MWHREGPGRIPHQEDVVPLGDDLAVGGERLRPLVHLHQVIERQLQAHLDSRGHVWAVVPTWTTSWGLEVGRTL